MSDDAAGFDLVMPFVVVKSAGGPYDDAAFVAGCRLGDIDRQMQQGEAVIEQYVDPESLPQYDLMAMNYGYSMESEPWDDHPDEWALLKLTKITEATL